MSQPRAPYDKMLMMNWIICGFLFLFPLLPLVQGWDLTVVGLMLLPAVVWLGITLRMVREVRKRRRD
jgi:Flp pilus assembly protein protease CpaA